MCPKRDAEEPFMDRVEHGSRTILHTALRRLPRRRSLAGLSELRAGLGGSPSCNWEPSEVRRDLVARLRSEVEAGTYRPDPYQVAEAMLGHRHGKELGISALSC